MKCPRCQQETPSDADFCPECGAKLAVVCTSCGTTNAPAHKFCKKCGQRLGPDVGAGQPPERFTSPESYTPRHLAEKILTSKVALEGERKQVTVLFADLKGSMELLADRDPEEARKLLDPVLERMMEAVHRYEGTVNQVMGDGIMALFGAPLALEDHAVRACYAALMMQETVKRYAEEVRRAKGVAVQIRIGLNAGEVVVRSVGSDLRMDYTAVGQTTHLAARMEQLADPGTVLLTADTLHLAEGFVQVHPLGPVNVKGLQAPVAAFELTGASPVRSRLQAAAARGFTRFVGRDAELVQLHEALAQAKAGRGQIVAVVGEPGVGKSRLFWEFTHSFRTQGCLVIEASSVSYGRASPYLPVIDLLKGYFQIEPRDDSRRILEKVTGKVLSLDESLRPSLPVVLSLLDVPLEDTGWQALDPPQRRRRILDGLKALLLRESQVQPLVVIFEDLHWIDSETQALLDVLVESLPAAPILLLGNYRPEYQHAWGSKTYYRQVRIDPLPRRSADQLLAVMLGDDSSLPALKALLIQRTEGNPFFLEESVQTLVETGAIIGERGAYRLAKAADAWQVPATAQAMLAARIDRLTPEDKRLLQTAAVIGKDVPLSLLQALADAPDEALRTALSHLQAAEFFYEARLFPEVEYTFKHALTHEVAYGSLLQERRRTLHARIVETIEELYPHRLGEQIEQLGHHAFQGQVWAKAVAWLRQAAAKAVPRSANRAAVTFLERALVALSHLPESRETLEQAIDLRFELRNPLFQLGEVARSLDYLREAETLAQGLSDQHRLGRVFYNVGFNYYIAGSYDRALESGARALAAAESLGDLSLLVTATLNMGRTFQSLGDYPRAIEVLNRIVARLEGQSLHESFGMSGTASVLTRSWLVWCLAERGEFADGLARGEEAVRIAEAVGNPFSVIAADRGLGFLYLRRGELQKTIPMLERGLALCETATVLVHWPNIASQLGYAYALLGRTAEAVPLLERAEKQDVSMRVMAGHSLRVMFLSEAYLLAGRRGEAVQRGQHALHLSREHSERGHEAYALRLIGEIASHADPPDVETAANHYHQARTRAEDLGMRPLVAHCHAGLAKLYRRTGKCYEAQEHITTATTMYREMGMTFWLEKAEAEMRELG